MSRTRIALSAMCVLVLAGSAWGQPAGPAGAAPAATNAPAAGKPAPILDVVPGGTLAFVVVPNVGKTVAAAEQYLKDIGAREMLGIEGDLLTAIKTAAQLGDGFNPRGGFAAAMLDPVPYGIDLAKMMKEGGPAPGAEKPKVPFVLFVPASGVKEVFGKYEMKAEGDLTLIQFRAGPVYAAMKNGYAVVSPLAKAVQDVLAAKTKAASELPKELVEAFGASDAAVHVNVKAAGPLLQAFMQLALAQAHAQAKASSQPAMPISPEQILSMYAKVLEQLHGLSYTLQVGPKAVVFQEYVAFDPAGAIGKAMAAVKPGESAGLDRLPNLPYALAVGSLAGAKSPGDKEMMDLMLKALPALKDETRARVIKLSQDCDEQITATQFVLGGPAEGAGVLGLAVVVSCKDAGKLKAVLAESADTIAELIQVLIPNPDLAGLKVAYVKEAEKLDSLAVDAIEFLHPALAKLSDDEKAAVAKILGEAKVRFLLAAADDKTLVVTFGGGTALLAEAMKVAKGGGTIPKNAGVLEAMLSLPKQPQMVMMLDGASALALAKKVTEALGQPLPPIELTAKTPLGIGADMAGGMVRVVVFIPNDLVKDVVKVIQKLSPKAGPGPGEAPAPVRGGKTY